MQLSWGQCFVLAHTKRLIIMWTGYISRKPAPLSFLAHRPCCTLSWNWWLLVYQSAFKDWKLFFLICKISCVGLHELKMIYPKYMELEMGFLLRWVNDKSEFSLLFIYYASDPLSVTPPPPPPSHTHTHTRTLWLRTTAVFTIETAKAWRIPGVGKISDQQSR